MDIQTKDELLEQISLAVEQIQKQYVQGEVIKDCKETYFLCKCIDEILHHGLKEGLISWSTEPSIWPLLEKITCAKDIEEINMLHLKSDKEKCNVWIHMAVNVNLLGSYISTLNQDKSLLSHHYYDYAFLRDPVLSDTVQSLLNYGIANVDFQITVDEKQLLKHNSRSRKQVEALVAYDSYDKAKVNNDELSRTELVVGNKENFSKKKKKKKKQAIQTVVITDLDNGGASDEQNDPGPHELTNSGNVDKTEKINKQNFQERGNEDDTTDDCDKPSKLCNTDDIKCYSGVFDKSPVISERSNDSKVTVKSAAIENNDRDSTLHSENASSKVVTTVNGEVTNQRTSSDHKMHEGVTEKSQLSVGSDDQRAVVHASSGIENYMLTQSFAKPTRTSDAINSLPREENGSKAVVSYSDLEEKKVMNPSGTFPGQEYSATDFHLEDPTGPDGSRNKSIRGLEEILSRDLPDTLSRDLPDTLSRDLEDTLTRDMQETLTDPKNEAGNDVSETVDSRNLRDDKTVSTKNQNSKNFEKSEKSDSGVDSRSERYSSSRDDFGTAESNDCTEISSKPLSYHVKKVENPEFMSSSYSSSLSDFTDTSYDDRDLNFIPGIHKLSSSYKSGSSCERRSTRGSSFSFDENGFPLFDTSHYMDSSPRKSSLDDTSGRFADVSSEWDMFEDLLNVEEEHFSGPESFAGLSTSEELEIAIEHYKKMIAAKRNKAEERDELVQKLIKLRLRLQHEKDSPAEVNPGFRKILSHHFSKDEEPTSSKFFCDQCGKIIWTMWQTLFTCKDCVYHAHRKCLDRIQRPCPSRNLSSVSYVLDICPDTGLDAQQYRCAECRKSIAFSKDNVSEARLCDYTGQYFCDHCHWNDQMSIPSRVIKNWDFTPYKVCRQTKQLLDLMKTRPLLNLHETNPMLFRYVEELREVGKLREDILIMKKYFLTCREALESKLLVQLQKRQHFVDNCDSYSFQDLLDLNNDILLPEVSKIHALFLAHIKADCELCRARGFICEVCQDSSDVIFAFDPHAVKCKKCSAVFHKICFKPEDCPKCQRKKKVQENT